MNALPRQAVERVLARAAELQAVGEAEPGETLSEERLIDIAREVGLDPAHVRQALAEERAQALAGTNLADAAPGPLLGALGPAAIGAQRTVPGTPLAILDRLEAYLPQGELLARIRRTGDRSWWEPQQGGWGNLLRGLGGGRRYDFVLADQVIATVTPLDEARCVLRIDTQWHGARRAARAQAITIAVALGLFVGAAALPLLVLGLIVAPFAYLTMALLSGLALAGSVWHWRMARRRYQRQLDRARMRIDALLDELEHERLRPPPTVVERLLGR